MEYLSGNSNNILSLFNINISVVIIFIISILVIIISKAYNEYITKYRIKNIYEMQIDTNKKINDIYNMLSDSNKNNTVENDKHNNKDSL